jgi:hypothetical protein
MLYGEVEPAGIEPELGVFFEIAPSALGCLTEQDRRRDTHVQALDEAPHRHADAPRASTGEVGSDSLALVSHDESEAREEREVARRKLAFRMGPHEIEAGAP